MLYCVEHKNSFITSRPSVGGVINAIQLSDGCNILALGWATMTLLRLQRPCISQHGSLHQLSRDAFFHDAH